MNTSPETTHASKRPTPEAKKRTFFEHLARRYWNEMHLLLRTGKLTSKDAWRNVAEHCLVQTAVAEELCTLLQLSEADIRAICKTAAIHDCDKRAERTGAVPPASASEAFNALDVNPDLFAATNTDVLAEWYTGERAYSFLQKVQHYLDLIIKESTIVRMNERIAEVAVAKRSAGLAEKANGKFWDYVRKHGNEVEQEIFERLRAAGHDIKAQEDIPLFLLALIEAKYQ